MPSSRSRAGSRSSGGSPGHQTVTGRSCTSSGSTSAVRCRPVSPPAVRKIISVQVSGASSRGRTQWAWIRASSHGGPSGSADSTIRVRDGWRPVSRWIVSAARSPTSGCRATTTRFITDVRAAMCRPGAWPSVPMSRLGCAQIRLSSVSISSIECACESQRIVGSPGFGGSASSIRPPPAGRVPTAMISPNSRPPAFGPLSAGSAVRGIASPPSGARWMSAERRRPGVLDRSRRRPACRAALVRRHGVRSGASAGLRGRAGPRPPRDPTSRPRSWGTPAAAISAHVAMIGSTMPHASSTSSARVNSDASPSSDVEDQRLVRVGLSTWNAEP